MADAGIEHIDSREEAAASQRRQFFCSLPEVASFRPPGKHDNKRPQKVCSTNSMALDGEKAGVRYRREIRRNNTEWHHLGGPNPATNLAAAEGQHKQITITTANQHRIIRRVAQKTDAFRMRISYESNIDNWDPTKRPIIFLNFVFDLFSIGSWLIGMIDRCLGHGAPIGENAKATKNLAWLLENLDYKVNDANYYFSRLREQDKELVASFIDSGERLFDDFRKLLQTCEDTILLMCGEGDQREEFWKNNSRAKVVVRVLWSRENRSTTVAFVHQLQIWDMQYDTYCSAPLIIAKQTACAPAERPPFF